jgi:hypothetical protein
LFEVKIRSKFGPKSEKALFIQKQRFLFSFVVPKPKMKFAKYRWDVVKQYEAKNAKICGIEIF